MAQETRYPGHPISRPQEGKLSTHTIHAYVRTLKVFANWLFEEGMTPSNALSKLKRPKLPETVIEVLTEAEIVKVLEATNPDSFLGARLYTILLVLLDTGIRATELLTMAVEHVDLSMGQLKVKGKGNKERVVPFATTTKKALLKWLTIYHDSGSKLVFHGLGGTTDLHGPGTSHQAGGREGGSASASCPPSAPTFAVRWLVNGGDVMSLKAILGHVDITTTQLYVLAKSSPVL